MRLQFRTLTRPKHLAERIETVFPFLSHMQAQTWAAKMLGYRSWHELASSVGPHVEETPDFNLRLDRETGVTRTEEIGAFLNRQEHQKEVLFGLVGTAIPYFDALFCFVDPNEPNVRFDKLGKVPKGTGFQKGLAHDLYEPQGPSKGEQSGHVVDLPISDADVYVQYGVPKGSDEKSFVEELLSLMNEQGALYPGYDEEVRECLLHRGPYGVTRFDGSGGDPEQWRTHRFFCMEDDKPEGFAVVTTSANAGSDEEGEEAEPYVFFQVTVEEAWCDWMDDDGMVIGSLAFSIALTISEAVARVLWMRVGAPKSEVTVQVFTESESEFAWYLVPAISLALQDELRSRSELPNGERMAGDPLEGVSFDEGICP